MTRDQIRQAHRQQVQIFRTLRQRVKHQYFVFHGHDLSKMTQAKLYFLNNLKHNLKCAFHFNAYQAEFVKNEAISRVLHRHNSPERMLVAPNTKQAEKLVHASFVLGRHYFRFIMTML